MDDRVYFVVDLDGLGFVFDNIQIASAFMAAAADHAKQGRYYKRRPIITMVAASYDNLHENFPTEYPIPTPDSLLKYVKADIQSCMDARQEDANEDPT